MTAESYRHNDVASSILPYYLRLLLTLLLVVSSALIAFWLHTQARLILPDASIEISEMFYSSNNNTDSPVDEESNATVKLNRKYLNNSHNHSIRQYHGTYTVFLDLNVPPDRLWALYCPKISVGSKIYLNSKILGESKSKNFLSMQIGNTTNTYLNIPNGLLKRGRNQIQIKTKETTPTIAVLFPFHLGPDSELRNSYEKQNLFAFSLAFLTAVLLLFTATAYFVLFLFCQNDPVYGWFSLLCVTWALMLFSHHTPIQYSNSLNLSIPILDITTIVFICALVIFLHRSVNLHRINFELIVIFIGLLAVCIDQLISLTKYSYLSHFPVQFFLWLGCAYLVSIPPINRNSQNGNLAYLMIVPLVILLTSQSLNIYNQYLSLVEMHINSLYFAAPFFVFVAAIKLIKDLVDSRENLRISNLSLEKRVKTRSQQLEDYYRQLQTMEKQRIIAEERDRIMMEMHDGLGSHLISMISLLDTSVVDPVPLRKTVKFALDDLRIVIDSLDPDITDLGDVLGMARSRIENSLSDSGIRLVWCVEYSATTRCIDPSQALQLLRIVQEACSNVLKHANASELTIGSFSHGGDFCIFVKDNGSLYEVNKTGRGIINMSRRAREIGAVLTIENGTSGTEVRLTFA